jgi:antitoxin ParD1/3/4
MTNLNISLPKAMREFVEAQVADGEYNNVSAYVRELIRQEQQRQSQQELEAALIEGLESGRPIKVTKEFWSEKRSRLVKKSRHSTASE